MQGRRLSTRFIYFGMASFAVALNLMSLILPKLADEFHVGLGRLGIVFTANFLGYCIMLALTMLLAGRIPRSRVYLFCGLGMGLSLLAASISGGIYVFYLVTACIGGCGAIVESLGGAVLKDLNPERPNSVLNIFQVFFALGAMAGPLITGFLIERGVSWRWLYICNGLFALAVFLPMLGMRFSRVEEAPFSRAGLLLVLRDRWFLGMIAIMAIYVGAEVGVWGWLSTFTQKDLHFTPLRSSVALALFWFSMMIGRAVCSKIPPHVPLNLVLLVLFTLGSIATGLIWLFITPVSIWLLIFLVGMGFSGIFGIVLAYGSMKYPEHATMVFNLLFIGCALGGMLIPAMVGFISERTDFRGGLLFLACVQVLAVAIVIMLGRSKERPAYV